MTFNIITLLGAYNMIFYPSAIKAVGYSDHRAGGRVGGADACKHDNFKTPSVRTFNCLPHVCDTNLKVKFDIQ